MRIPIDFAIDSCTISLALVAIVEPITVSRSPTRGVQNCILVSTILVRSRGTLDNMRRRRFADAQVEKRGEDGGVEDVARVDEGLRCRVGELGEAGDGLLRSDKGTESVDVGIFGEIGEWERERVIGRAGGHCTGFTDSMREKSNAVQGFYTHRCKRQRLGYPEIP